MSTFATNRGRWLLVTAVAAAGLYSVVGCGGGDGRPSAAAVGGMGNSSGGSGNGSGGRSGSAGSAGVPSTGGGGAAGGTGAAAGTPGTGGIGTIDAGGNTGGGAGGVPPIDTACDRSMAFWATGASFAFPTPKNLAAALATLTYDYTEHPVTVVLAVNGGDATVAVSATEASGGSAPAFLAGTKPQFVPAAISIGGFATTATQTQAWLRVKDESGFKDIELNNVDLSVVTSNQCSTLLALLTAVIPGTQGAVVLDLPSGSTTIESLAGSSAGGGQTPPGSTTGWNLRMVFSGESTDFDFKSL